MVKKEKVNFTNKEKSYIWDLIEKNVFFPSSLDDKRNWVKQFLKFIKSELQVVESFAETTKSNSELASKDSVDFKFGEFSFSFPIDVSKFGFTINFKNQNKQIFHFDNLYLRLNIEKPQINVDILQNKFDNYPNEFKAIIKSVLEDIIVHPAIHNHVDEKRHGIRVGFSTKNPFLFLYQFCFQLMYNGIDYKSSTMKKDEINRLTEIIVTHLTKIKKIKQIPSGELFILKNN